MTSTDEPNLTPREEELLERFLDAHPLGDLETLETWASSEHELRSDPDLRERVRSSFQTTRQARELLATGVDSAQEAPSVFRRGVGGPAGDSPPAPTMVGGALCVGRSVGPFTLRRFIARGGMGHVWEAHDEHLRRTVALKLVLPERVDEAGLELFAREARAGGRLAHPNIVTTLAHGKDEGLSWIAQELVEGSHTLKDTLDTLRAEGAVPDGYYSQVAELVAQIADGLQAAHEAGVIHRDVKPQNILIAPDDTPKVTDFGLARVQDDSFHSVTGDFAGTWAYMSPEQVTGKRMGLDHRTDVFSLGVVLYELLALRRPFEGDTTQQIATKIIAFDPPQPSKVRSQCPRELAIICGMALEKDPQHRYLTMAGFAGDLRRHLADQPILARPPGPLVRAGKWTRRNPATSAAVAVATVSFVVISALFYRNVQTNQALQASNLELVAKTAEVSRERDAAALQRDITQAVNDFLNDDLLASVAPSAELGRGKDVTMREVLDTVAAKIEGRFEEHPRVEAQIRTTIGTTYAELGEHELATAHLIQALTVHGEVLGDEDPETLKSAMRLAHLLSLQGNYREAGEHLTEVLEVRSRTLGDEHPQTLAAFDSLGAVLVSQGELEEGAQHLARALEGRRRVLGDEHSETLDSTFNMASLLMQQGRLNDAERLFLEGLEGRRRVLGGDHRLTLASISAMGSVLNQQGRLDEAEPYFVEALEGCRRLLGDDHPVTLNKYNSLAFNLRCRGMLDEAQAHYTRALEGSRRVLGDDHIQTLNSIDNMGTLLQSQGRLEEAELHFAEALEGARRVLGDDHLLTLRTISNVGFLLLSQGKPAEAQPYCAEALAGIRRLLGEDHPRTHTYLINMGGVLVTLGKLAEAEPYFRKGLEGCRRVSGDDHLRTLDAIHHVAVVLRDQGNHAEAEAYLVELLERRRRVQGDDHARSLEAMSELIVHLDSQGKVEEARALALELQSLISESGSDHQAHRALLEAILE